MRRPAVAGVFYPARADEVHAQLSELVTAAPATVGATAIVVPHAGWMYSGRVAGEVYGRVSLPRLAIVLGPNHRGRGAEGAIVRRGRWHLPGGDVPIAEDLAHAVLATSLALEDDEEAHRLEHAIEVQLPFLRWLRSDLAFVPIILGRIDLGFCDEIGRAVAAAIRTFAEPVLVICSTDLNHYESQTVSNEKDHLAIDAMLAGDAARLGAVVSKRRISMCGVAAAMATLTALRELGGARGELVRYETSGDVSGDYTRVVGYAGLIFR